MNKKNYYLIKDNDDKQIDNKKLNYEQNHLVDIIQKGQKNINQLDKKEFQDYQEIKEFRRHDNRRTLEGKPKQKQLYMQNSSKFQQKSYLNNQSKLQNIKKYINQIQDNPLKFNVNNDESKIMKPTFDFNQNMNFQRQIAREKQIKAQQQLTETVNQVYNPLKKLQVQFEKNKLQNQQEKLQYYKELKKSKGEIMMQNKMFNEQETPLIQEGKISYDNLQDLKLKQFEDINKMIQDKNKDQILQELFDSSFENQGIKNPKKLNKQITINQIIKELCKQIAVIYLGYTGKKQNKNNGNTPLSYYFIYDYNKKNFQFFTKKCQKYYDNLFRQQQKKQQIKKQKNYIQIINQNKKQTKDLNQEIDILDEFQNSDVNKSNKGNNQKYLCDMYFLTEILKQNANKLNLDAFKILENPEEFIQQLWNEQLEIKTYLNQLQTNNQNRFQQQEEEKLNSQGKKQKNLKLLLMSEEQRQNFKQKLEEYKIQQLYINQDYEKLQQIQQQNEEKERIEFIKKGALLQQFQNDENFKNKTIFQNILQGQNQENEKLLQQKIFLAQIKKKSRINQLKIENSKKEIENEEKQLEQIIFEQLKNEFRDIVKIIENTQKQYVKEFNYYKKEESQAKLFELQEKFQVIKSQANFTQLSQQLENNVQQINFSQNKEQQIKKDQQEDFAQKQDNKQGNQSELKEILVQNTESTEFRKDQIIKELQNLKEFQLEPVLELQMKFGIESMIQFHQEQLDVYQKFQQLIEIKNNQLQCLIQDEKFSSKNKDHNNLEVKKNAENIKGLLSIEESYKGDKTFIQKILRQKGFSDSEKVNQIQILKRKKLDSIIAEFERNQEEEEKKKKLKFQSKQQSLDEKAKQQKNQQRTQIQRKQTQSQSNLDVFDKRSSFRNFSTCLNKKESGQKQTFQNLNNENCQLEPQQKQKDLKNQNSDSYMFSSLVNKQSHTQVDKNQNFSQFFSKNQTQNLKNFSTQIDKIQTQQTQFQNTQISSMNSSQKSINSQLYCSKQSPLLNSKNKNKNNNLNIQKNQQVLNITQENNYYDNRYNQQIKRAKNLNDLGSSCQKFSSKQLKTQNQAFSDFTLNYKKNLKFKSPEIISNRQIKETSYTEESQYIKNSQNLSQRLSLFRQKMENFGNQEKSQVNSFYTLESSIVKNKHFNTQYGDSKFNTNSHNISLQKSNISNSSINLPTFQKQVGDSQYKQKMKDFSYDINLQNLSKKYTSIKKGAKSLQNSIYISPKSFRNIEDYQWAVQVKSLQKEQEKTDREKCHDLASEFFDIVSQQHQKMIKKTKYSSQQMIKQGKEIKKKIFNQWEKQLENLDTKIDSHLIEFIKKNHKNAFEEDEDNIEETGRNRQKQLQLQKQLSNFQIKSKKQK